MSDASMITLSNFQIVHYFLAVSALLISAHVFGYLFSRYKLPRVIGEIVGGLVLGPSLLGFLFPDIYSFIFNAFPEQGSLISVVYELGLILLMFISGFEVQKSLDRDDSKIIIILMICSTLIPFIGGWLVSSYYDLSFLLGPRGNMIALQIVFATSVAVTSIPVISKIFIDLKLTQTRFAKVVLGAATIHDLILYVALAVATGLVGGITPTFSSIATVIAMTVLLFVISLVFITRVLKFASGWKYNVLQKSSPTGYALFICFLFAAVATTLNVNVMFGAFIAGICIGVLPNKSLEAEKESIKSFSLALFIPIYFAIVGLQIDLIHNFDVVFFLAFLLASTLLEVLGTLVAARLSRLEWKSSINLAVVMNARGGPGIVLATIALAAGIINENFFVTLVMSAIVTSLFAGWWLRRRTQEKEELLKKQKS